MRVAFRTDASTVIGSGHVMRCLALANELSNCGASCLFICREHDGNLIEEIERQGHTVRSLPLVDITTSWLGASPSDDASQTAQILNDFVPDWLIVDHYAIDSAWEKTVDRGAFRLLVIDDLADREHLADVLVDQNYGRSDQDYSRRVSADCEILVGPKYALLRPEFAEIRALSLSRRGKVQVKHVLLTMGGVDPSDATGQVLDLLETVGAGILEKITVAVGAKAVWREQLEARAREMRVPTNVHVGARNMAALMLEADLAIGAGGSTSWERCCLGLPTIQLSLADNQIFVSESLEKAGAAIYAGRIVDESWKDRMSTSFQRLAGDPALLASMSARAAAITDGAGAFRIANVMAEPRWVMK